MLELAGHRTAPTVDVYNPAFDVTPAELVSAVVSEEAVYVGAITSGCELEPPAVRAHATVLVETVRDLYGRGWMEGTSGNASVRSGDYALVTASGCSKGRLTSEDTVVVRISDGAFRAGSRRPSAETAIHLALYACLPDCGAVVHAHCPYATTFAGRWAAEPKVVLARIADYELVTGLGLADARGVDVPVFPNWDDVARIAYDVARHLGGAGAIPPPPVLVIDRHGATAWGADLDEARNRLECLEMLCRLELLALPVAFHAHADTRG